jgi:hypothetical protein
MSRLSTAKYLLLAAALTASARPALAQIEAGDKKISLDGSLTSQTVGGSSSTSGQIDGTIGYYLSRNIALRVTASEFLSSGFNMTLLGGGAEYNFAPATNPALPFMVPFVALDASTSLMSFSGASAGVPTPPTAINFRPAAGIRWFLSRQTSFDASASYTIGNSDSGGGAFAINFGLSFYFLKDSKK